jgi:uncharacterized protein
VSTEQPTPAAALEASDRTGLARLLAALGAMDGALLAYSGGVDSSLLLSVAREALGERVLAITARSATYPEAEGRQAEAIARSLGARHAFLDTRELEQADFRANPPERCYLCKLELFGQLRRLAAQEGLAEVVDGFNLDDHADYRPGHRAARELGVRSPLAEAGLGKAAVRRLARSRGLPNWDAPAAACLASRIPYGVELTPARLQRIERAEAAIRALGFRVVRVRDHGELARVELGPDELGRALAGDVRLALARACRDQGFTFASLDLEGYRTGSLNELLPTSDASEGEAS